jgi:hypothetical protein
MTDSTIGVACLEVGKMYMLSPSSIRYRYWLYRTEKDCVVNRGEPFMAVGCCPDLYGPLPAAFVCNSRGEVGMIDLSDVVEDKTPAFVPYVGEQ